MAFHGKLRHTGYAAAAVTILTCLYSSIAYASEDVAETSRESTDDIYVTANVDKEMLKEEPEAKTIISRADLDRKGARTLSDALAAEQDIQMARTIWDARPSASAAPTRATRSSSSTGAGSQVVSASSTARRTR